MQAPAGSPNARSEQILDGRLTILLLERDAPSPARMLLADGRQGVSNQPQVLRRQQPLSGQHLRVRNGGLDIVANQTIVEDMVISRREAKHARVERSSLVPESRHFSDRALCVAAMKSSARRAQLFRRAQGREIRHHQSAGSLIREDLRE